MIETPKRIIIDTGNRKSGNVLINRLNVTYYVV